MTLVSLRVRDLATIADVTLELGPGLNVLTGETGAGKSMLVDALALLLGDRADRAAVRPGASRAAVEGLFDRVPSATARALESGGFDQEEQLVLRREVTAEGRSRAWINGSPATIGALATIGATLIDLHGQHQTLQLLDRDTRRDLVDAAGEGAALRRVVEGAHLDLVARRADERALADRRDEARRRADWLRHVVQEIDGAAIGPDEDEMLDRDALRLSQAGALGEHARRITEAVDGDRDSLRHALARIGKSLAALERLDDTTAAWRELLDGIEAQADELGRLADAYGADLAEDPARLADLERRRDVLYRLKAKHGATLAEVLAVRDGAARELDLLDTADLDLRGLSARAAAAEEALRGVAAALTEARERSAAKLSREVTRLLPELGLAGGAFSIALEPLPEPGPGGAEGVAFLVRLNKGMEARPVERVASGGELSRLMLALKVALARHDAVPTLVFDEVDQGIGGEVGARVGNALARVAERHQVLVITHLPQIAGRADRHLRVAKATRGGVATSDVAVLHGEDRVGELARMLGDADDPAARRLALSLLGAAVSA